MNHLITASSVWRAFDAMRCIVCEGSLGRPAGAVNRTCDACNIGLDNRNRQLGDEITSAMDTISGETIFVFARGYFDTTSEARKKYLPAVHDVTIQQGSTLAAHQLSVAQRKMLRFLMLSHEQEDNFMMLTHAIMKRALHEYHEDISCIEEVEYLDQTTLQKCRLYRVTTLDASLSKYAVTFADRARGRLPLVTKWHTYESQYIKGRFTSHELGKWKSVATANIIGYAVVPKVICTVSINL
ncbi:hypothetical protein BDV95DRAFT_589898 [Massariosphaeria phaeospora]|uniref:Uncharacterized protein n=1 Tax=Massariosphaeria phaeospora TaxID=100035 RepID=A0A7C8MHY1_9PLEO|nr:hypothetical protein BDV95DRAFT_589898 [Massariosphaeria phaeospora]